MEHKVPPIAETRPMTEKASLDTVAIQQLILAWGCARDTKDWDGLASCFTANSVVEMSWFKGTGAEFAAAAKKIAGGGMLTFHEIGPARIQINQDRAIADTPMAAHVVREIGGVDVDITFWTRMRSRAERRNDRWLLSGLRIIYIHDLIVPRAPTAVPLLDTRLLASFRPTYRHLSYALATSGHPISNDLPGVDRPDLVEAMIAAEHSWLSE